MTPCRIRHTVCDGTAFVYAETPTWGTIIEASKCVDPPGMINGHPIICANCGQPAMTGDLVPEQWGTA